MVEEFSLTMFVIGAALMGLATVSINTLDAVLRGRRNLKNNPVMGCHGFPVVHGMTRAEPGKPGVTHGQTISRNFVRLMESKGR